MIEITVDNLKDTIASGVVLIDFWAEWCGPCKAFAPVFESAERANPDVVFAKCDVSAQPDLASAFAIRAIPALLVFKDGALVMQQMGMLPMQALEDVIQRARDFTVPPRAEETGAPDELLDKVRKP